MLLREVYVTIVGRERDRWNASVWRCENGTRSEITAIFLSPKQKSSWGPFLLYVAVSEGERATLFVRSDNDLLSFLVHLFCLWLALNGYCRGFWFKVIWNIFTTWAVFFLAVWFVFDCERWISKWEKQVTNELGWRMQPDCFSQQHGPNWQFSPSHERVISWKLRLFHFDGLFASVGRTVHSPRIYINATKSDAQSRSAVGLFHVFVNEPRDIFRSVIRENCLLLSHFLMTFSTT